MVTGILIDTCVVSELARPRPAAAVMRWARATAAGRLWTSVMVFGELHKGICLLDDGTRRRALVAWLAQQRAAFGDRCLGIDEPIARAWGDLHASCQRAGRPLPTVDGLIAATALVRGLTIATRNRQDFEMCGVQIEDPWTA